MNEFNWAVCHTRTDGAPHVDIPIGIFRSKEMADKIARLLTAAQSTQFNPYMVVPVDVAMIPTLEFRVRNE